MIIIINQIGGKVGMCKPNYGGIVLLPLLLASCIGGNFGVQPVVESTPTAYPVTFKSKDVPTPPPCRAFYRNHAGQPARRRCGNAAVEAEYCFSS